MGSELNALISRTEPDKTCDYKPKLKVKQLSNKQLYQHLSVVFLGLTDMRCKLTSARNPTESGNALPSQRKVNQCNSQHNSVCSCRREKDILSKIEVVHVSGNVDKTPTKIEETENVLRYITPKYRAHACVSVPPLAEGEAVKLGWIQACSKMKFKNTYGSYGSSSWEFREIELGAQEMVSDSDGRCYPWYGISQHQNATIKGPTKRVTLSYLCMHDNFSPQVTWCIPAEGYSEFPALTSIVRDQNFFTWLVAYHVNSNTYHPLATLKWTAKLEINIDPFKNVKSRGTVVSEGFSREECVQEQIVPIPRCILQPDCHANSTQMLVWRPTQGDPEVIILPLKMPTILNDPLVKKRDKQSSDDDVTSCMEIEVSENIREQ